MMSVQSVGGRPENRNKKIEIEMEKTTKVYSF